MNTELLFFVCVVCATRLPTIADAEYRLRSLHTMHPAVIEHQADLVINTLADWQMLRIDVHRVQLVFLKTFCELPDVEMLAQLRGRVVLFGPLYSYHHLNFGTFTQSRLEYFANIFEAHMSKKLKLCKNGKTLLDVRGLLDSDVVLAWYASQEIDVYHSKVRPYPIGFGYLQYRVNDDVEMRIDEYKQRMLAVLDGADQERRLLLLASFSPRTELYKKNFEEDPRAAALEAVVANESFGIKRVTKFTSDEAWLGALVSTKFILSPAGWGPDCHRHYEALAMGCVPIVMENYGVSQLLESLPVLMLQNWRELTVGGPDFLEREYEKLRRKTYKLDKLFADYWEMKLRQP